jgi:ClpP class serine protease
VGKQRKAFPFFDSYPGYFQLRTSRFSTGSGRKKVRAGKGESRVGRGSKHTIGNSKNGGRIMRKLKGVLDKSNDREKMIDPGRAIFVQGDMDEALVSALTPKIIALRKNPMKPITVFIDSPGGSVGVYKTLVGLLNLNDA